MKGLFTAYVQWANSDQSQVRKFIIISVIQNNYVVIQVCRFFDNNSAVINSRRAAIPRLSRSRPARRPRAAVAVAIDM